MKKDLFTDFVTNFRRTYSTEEILLKSGRPSADSRTCGIARTREQVFQNLAKRTKWLREAANRNNYERNRKKQRNKSCDKRSYWEANWSEKTNKEQEEVDFEDLKTVNKEKKVLTNVRRAEKSWSYPNNFDAVVSITSPTLLKLRNRTQIS